MLLLAASATRAQPSDGLGALKMTDTDFDQEKVHVRAISRGEVEQQISRTQYMLAATSIASMSIIAVAALFMSLFF